MRRQKMRSITDNLACIENGDYKILLSDRTIIYKETAKEFVKQFEIIQADCFRHLQNMGMTIKDKPLNAAFCGQVVMLTSNNDCKIFDVKNRLVLSVLDEAAQKRFHDIYDIFQGKLQMTYVSDTKEGVVEKIIQNIPRNIWSRSLIVENYLRILSDQLYYLKQTSVTGEKNCQDIWNDIQDYQFVELNVIGKRIFRRIEGRYTMPCVFLHRDIHFENTLFDGKNLYYIDFEYADNEIFLYDIFNCIFVEFMRNHEPLLLSLYMKKNADIFNYLYKIFAVVGMNFSEERSLDYIYIFLLARLKFTCDMISKCSTNRKRKKICNSQKKYFSIFCDYLEEHENGI